MDGRDLTAELAFWTTDLIEWKDATEVEAWGKFEGSKDPFANYWYRTVHFRANGYGDIPYRTIYVYWNSDGTIASMQTYKNERVVRSW